MVELTTSERVSPLDSLFFHAFRTISRKDDVLEVTSLDALDGMINLGQTAKLSQALYKL
jgi:hypothetical protein